MPILEPDASPAAPLLTPDASAPAADPAPSAAPVDPLEGAADKIFDHGNPKPEDKPAEVKPEDKPAETPEEKAAREAAETPEEKAAREAKEAEEAKKAEGAPEAYADFTVPEGVTLNADALESFKAIAKEDNLSQGKAQRYIDAAVKFAADRDAAAAAQIDTIKAGWREATTADKEFGGDKLQESLAVAQKALKQFGSPELNELVVGAGLGDHPEFVRLLVRVGKAVSEAPIVNGGQPAAKDAASVLYPNLPRKQ